MAEVMAVLYSNGQKALHLGAMMRLIGVDEETASKYDDHRIDIDENFLKLASELNIEYLIRPKIPVGTTIH